MLTDPITVGPQHALVKIDPVQYPHLVANEARHLDAAQALGLPVAQHRIIEDVHGVQGLLITRFDRAVAPDGTVRRFAMEDGAQVLGVLPAQKYALSSEEVTRALAAQTSAPRIAARALYLQFLFAWLTGNGDLHAKNLTVLQEPSGRRGLSPIYDIPSSVVYRDMTMALTIDGRDKRLRRRHWDAFAAAIALPARAASSAIDLALRASAGIDLSALGFTGSLLYGAERELRMRRTVLEL